MNTHEFQALGLEEFIQETKRCSDQLKSAILLHNKLNISRGVNQTLAMECETLRHGYITTMVPLASYSVQPSRTNFKLAMEELSHIEMAAIGGLAAIGLGILWKIIKWFKKWRSGGEESSGGGEGGSGGSEGGGYMPASRAGAVITGSVDVMSNLDGIKTDLVAACLKGGAVSRMDITKQLEDISIKEYEDIGNLTTVLFDNFINKTGAVAVILKLHEGALKEAPTKVRDVFNKLEQIITTYTGSNDVSAREAEVDKIKMMRSEVEDSKSFWYSGEITGAATCSDLTALIKKDISDARNGPPSKLGQELVGRTSNFTDKLRQGLHGTYEKLDSDTALLFKEVSTDLQSKITSLTKQIQGDKSHQSAGDSGSENVKDFASNAGAIVQLLNGDVTAIGNLIHASEMICKDYAGVIGALPKANQRIIAALLAVAKKNKAADMMIELNKLKIANDKLIKNR